MIRRKFIKGSAILGATIAGPSFILDGSGLITSKGARKIYRILNSDKINVGTLPVLRVFAGDHEDYVSPFVLFDEFGPIQVNAGDKPLRVDAHPHAGITPTTYFLEGTGHHKDSLDYDIQIGKGDFMMFKSGRGAIHMEESGQKLYEEGGAYHGFQIWLNTPAQYKFDAPATTIDDECNMGHYKEEGVNVKIVLGELMGQKSTIETHAPAFYYHIKLDKNTKFTLPTNPTHNAFIYNIKGHLELDEGKSLKAKQIALYERGAIDINLFAKEGSELLVLGGAPLNEPVFSYGPFVMNNEDQISQCIDNYNKGLMGDPNLVDQ